MTLRQLITTRYTGAQLTLLLELLPLLQALWNGLDPKSVPPRSLKLLLSLLKRNPFRSGASLMTVTHYLLTDAGSSYSPGQIAPLVDVTNNLGSGARLQVDQVGDGVIAATALAASGSGYAPHDTFRLLGGNNDATGMVDVTTAVAGGVALTYHLTNHGQGYAATFGYLTRVLYGPGRGLIVAIQGVTAQGAIASSTLASGGSGGYSPGAPFRVLHGHPDAHGVVDAATPRSGGEVLSWHLTHLGTGYTPGVLDTQPVRSTGSGLRLDITTVREQAIVASHLVSGGRSYAKRSHFVVPGAAIAAHGIVTGLKRL